jgi:hypothetical protein
MTDTICMNMRRLLSAAVTVIVAITCAPAALANAAPAQTCRAIAGATAR